MRSRKVVVSAAMVVLVIFNKLVLSRHGLPNVELIIPALIVLSNFAGSRKAVIASVLLVSIIDVLLWGFRWIYAFTWSGFLLCWYLWGKDAFNPFYQTKKILKSGLFLAMGAILFFDAYTALGCWLLWYPRTPAGLVAAYISQVPFTLYHLLSLGFVPPLVLLGKKLIRVPVEIPVAVRAQARVKKIE